MSRRLRPVREHPLPQKPASPTPDGLENPYARYYSHPRSFEQLVRQQRPLPPEKKTK